MISKRKLTAWRREALAQRQKTLAQNPTTIIHLSPAYIANERILIMTQELLDQILLSEASKEQL